VLNARVASGNGYCVAPGDGGRHQPVTARDFRVLHPGEQWTIVGEHILWNDPHNIQPEPPRLVAAGLRFGRKGTSCGLDAWVGEVWAEPILVR
jgi:hypothetical protein